MAAQPRAFTRILEAELIFENGLPPRGVGSFGKVVVARYKGGLVAVKCLSVPQSKVTPADQAALATEIAALAGLKHPNIVTLIGVCYHADGAISIVEELADCDAVDFCAALGGRGVPTDMVYKLGLDIARGMHFMHSNGLTHNDMKSGNVLLVKGCAILTDFGLCKKFTDTLAKTQSLVSGAVGTLPYMAPENMDGEDPNYLKPCADVYSFGCILYELATGKCPWADKPSWGTMQFLRAVNVGKQRQPLDAVEPAALRALIARCWLEPAAQRPNAAALVAELTALHIGAAAAQPPQDLPALRRLVEICRRHGIRPDYVRPLRNLEAFDIVVIADDSGSMAAEIKQGDGAKSTRWAELKGIVQVVVELAAALDDDGCDVYFLNRPDARGVRDAAAAAGRFVADPDGGTPLTATLTRALHDKGLALAGEAPAAGGAAATAAAAAASAGRAGAGPAKRVLFLIATDGVPNEGPEAFVSALQRLPENCYVQLMAVTDDDSIVEWMNKADDVVRFVDVNDVRVCVCAEVGGGASHCARVLPLIHLPPYTLSYRTTGASTRRWWPSRGVAFPSHAATTLPRCCW